MIDLTNATGIPNYTKMLYSILETLENDLNYVFLEAVNKNKYIKKIPFKFFLLFYPWLNTIFYIQTLIKKPDAIIFPNFTTPIIKRKKTHYSATVHDLSPYIPDTMPFYGELVFKFSILTAVKFADTVLTVSETVKQEIIEKFKVDADRIKVTYNTFSDLYLSSVNDPEVLERYTVEKQKYILSVATLHKRKNIPALVKAFEHLSEANPDLKLVLVGGMGNEARKELTSHENVIFTGYVADEELPTLYKNALMYVFPSVYEGFGIPILEAQASGTPVIASDIPVFREVGADTVLYCPTDPEGMAKTIQDLIDAPALRDELVLKGRENIKRFSKEVIAEQVREVFSLE